MIIFLINFYKSDLIKKNQLVTLEVFGSGKKMSKSSSDY